MNGESLSAHHGGPLRLVVPGYLGARWVKWLDTITVSTEESPNFYQQHDYKILPPQVSLIPVSPMFFSEVTSYVCQIDTKEAAQCLWSNYPSMTALPINSVVASVTRVPTSGLMIKGYAVGGADGNVARVEISLDNGTTWRPTKIIYQEGRWSWALWEILIEDAEESGKIFSRAIDEHGFHQEKEGGWNIRGVAYNAWGCREW
jgi:sulfite oxidase